MQRITIYLKRPAEQPVSMTIPNTLEAFQRLVDGYIETVRVASDLVIICNEEGKLLGLPENVDIGGDVLVGNIVFASVNGEEFDDAPDWELMADLFQEIFVEVGDDG